MIGARCCAAGQRSARRERLTDTRGCANERRESESEEEGGGRKRQRTEPRSRTSCQTLRATTNTHRKQEHTSRWATKNAATRSRTETLCVHGCVQREGGPTQTRSRRTSSTGRDARERGRHEAVKGGKRAGVPTGRTAGGRPPQGQLQCGDERRGASAIKICAASVEKVKEGRMGRTGRLRWRVTASGRRGRGDECAPVFSFNFFVVGV